MTHAVIVKWWESPTTYLCSSSYYKTFLLCRKGLGEKRMKQFKIGLQLYTVRNHTAENMLGTLEKVKAIGYDYVELAGFGDSEPAAIASKLRELGMHAVSCHSPIEPLLDPDKSPAAIRDCKELGYLYYVLPWMDAARLADEASLAKVVSDFTAAGDLLAKNGIRFGYHNHDFEFTRMGEHYAIDLLYESVSAELLFAEFDTCWVRFAGEDPAAYIRKYAGRCPVVHLKDFVCDTIGRGDVPYALIDASGNDKSKAENKKGFQFRPVGSGVQDIPAIVEASEFAGSEYLIVEQDDCNGLDTLDCAKQSREYLASLGL